MVFRQVGRDRYVDANVYILKIFSEALIYQKKISYND